MKLEFRAIVGILVLGFSIILLFVGVVLVANRPPSAKELAATLTALPSPTWAPTATPTPIPTIPGVTADLLACQRQAGIEMNERDLVGAVNISDDHLFRLTWVAHGWEINDLDDALPGVILGLDVALDVWQNGCAVYDRIQIDVWERSGERQSRRLSVQSHIDDLIAWRDKTITDQELIARLEIVAP